VTALIAGLTLPLLATLATVALPRRARRPAALLGTGLTLIASIWLSAEVWQDGPVTLSLGGWQPPIGIVLRADGLGAALGVMTALVVLRRMI